MLLQRTRVQFPSSIRGDSHLPETLAPGVFTASDLCRHLLSHVKTHRNTHRHRMENQTNLFLKVKRQTACKVEEERKLLRVKGLSGDESRRKRETSGRGVNQN